MFAARLAPVPATAAIAVLGALGACDLYIPRGDPDAARNDGREPPPDAVPADAPRDGGQQVPTAAMHAHQPVVGGGFVDVGLADWTCVGQPRDRPRGDNLLLSGTVIDWQTGTTTFGRRIVALPAADRFPVLGETFATELSGAYSIELAPPPGARYAFRMVPLDGVGPTALVENVYVPPGPTATRTLAVVSPETADVMPQNVGLVRDVSRGVLIGDIVDCQNRPVSNAMVTINATDDEQLTSSFDVVSFFRDQPTTPMAINVPTEGNGRFASFFLRPDVPWFVQVWGFRDDLDLEVGTMARVAMIRVTPMLNSVTTALIEPRQQ